MIDLSAAFFRKEGRPVIIHLLRQMYLTGGKPTKSGISTIRRFLKEINLLKKHQGLIGTVKYLKGCSVLLQQAVAGHVLPDVTPLGPRVRRSHSGIPSIIPAQDRFAICKGDIKVLRLWMTLFSIYRNIDYIGKVKFETIVSPYKGKDIDFEKYIPRFINLFVNKSVKLDFSTPFSILTSSPSVNSAVEVSTSVWSLVRSCWSLHSKANSELERAFFFMIKYTKSETIRTLYSEVVRFLEFNHRTISGVNTLRMNIGKNIIKLIPDLGKLAIKEEPAGKMRVFAMVDAWTQWALQGLHKYLFSIIRKHVTDGTFDQLRPLRRVPFGEKPIYSLDLSAATDRLPLTVQIALLSRIFGKRFATAWGDLLVKREYKISHLIKDYPYISKYGKSIKYTVGQPMGALSSWAMLALTHHYIVNMAAWEAGHSKRTLFLDYAVLGDDIVIWDPKVASFYQSIMKSLGVELGLAKSVISPDGLGLEFAKKTILKGVDVSPFPLKEARASHRNVAAILEIQRKYNLSDLSIIRWLGYGYKVSPSKLSSTSMRIFSLLKEVPQNARDLFRIFLVTNPYLKDNVLKQDVLFGKLVNFVDRELSSAIRRISKLIDTLHQWDIASHMDASFPLFPRPHSIMVKNLEKVFDPDVGKYIYLQKDILTMPTLMSTSTRKIERGVVDVHIERALKTLIEMRSLLKMAKSMIYGLVQHTNHKFYPLPPYGYIHMGKNIFLITRSAACLFRAEKEISNISIKDLINPSRSVSDSEDLFSGLEDKATIRRWNRWFRVFLKISLIKDESRNNYNLLDK